MLHMWLSEWTNKPNQTQSKLSSISEKFEVYRIDSSKNIVHTLLLKFNTSFAEILSDHKYEFWSNAVITDATL
jgi:hypothetical protein